MKKKFLIPTLGVVAFAMALTFSTSSITESTPLFVDSDNIAFAQEVQECGYREEWLCVTDTKIEKDSEYCNGGGTIITEIR